MIIMRLIFVSAIKGGRMKTIGLHSAGIILYSVDFYELEKHMSAGVSAQLVTHA